MDGTKTNVANYVKLAKKYNALTYLDEVHAVGLYGKGGKGIAHKNKESVKREKINKPIIRYQTIYKNHIFDIHILMLKTYYYYVLPKYTYLKNMIF